MLAPMLILAGGIALAPPDAAPREAALVEVAPPGDASADASREAPAIEEPSSGGAPPMPEVEELPSRGGAPPMPAVEELPSRGGAPPMPAVEELPSRGDGPEEPPPRRGPTGVTIGGPKDRAPVGGGGVGFFDPGKLEDAGAGGGVVQIRGYLGVNFAVAERTDITARNPDTGTFDRLKTLPYFGGGAANLFVGAPVYSDVVYVRISMELLMFPKYQSGAADVSPAWLPTPILESAALEVNPFAWASKAPAWLRDGFKITGGVFVLPFGLEDEQHDAPVRWFVSRPLAMSSGRVYPGSWVDAGIGLKWKPTFGKSRISPRPIEIDFGVVNSDPCTQTRATDILYRYRPVGQVDEVCERPLRDVEVARADGSVLGITPDNNGNKSIFARVQLWPVPALNLGGSLVWGTHPQSVIIDPDAAGTYIDGEQAPTWRVGGHVDLNLDEALQSPFPLPHLRAELVYGVDQAVPVTPGFEPLFADRRMIGGYAQIAQPLWRRKKTRLPGLILQYRFDYNDPDLAIPGVVDGVNIAVDFADQYLYDEAIVAHIFGLRLPVLPRFSLRAEFGLLLEEGGAGNQLHNNFFGLQAVADF